MFDNIGSKIKTLAVIIAWVGIIGSIIAGIILISIGISMNNSSWSGSPGAGLIWSGIVCIIWGSLLSWISSFVLYGFGELIVKTTEIERNTSKKGGGSLTAKMENEKKMASLLQWKENGLISEEEFELKKQALLKEE